MAEDVVSLPDLPGDVLQIILLYVSDFRTLVRMAPLHSNICEQCSDDELWQQQVKLHIGENVMARQAEKIQTDETWQGWFKFFVHDIRRRAALKVVEVINTSREQHQRPNAQLLQGVVELNFSAACLGTQGAEFLAATLEGNQSVEHLNVARQLVRETGIRALSPALANIPTLLVLNLESNKLGPKGGAALQDMLSHPGCKLRSLNVSDNFLGEQGAVSLAGAVAGNKHLRWLKADRNKFGDKGVAAIAKANTRARGGNVQHLSLRDNGIGSAGVDALCEMLSDAPVGFQLLDLTSALDAAQQKGDSAAVNRTTAERCRKLRSALPAPPPPPPDLPGERRRRRKAPQ
eukprot:Hpha_TRINITY_DN1561_c0_g1::TRINITY_DN1561_c0_g1_i1::g.57286::m.57286